MTNVELTPELERFARECVAKGRYSDVSEVVRSALELLQKREHRRLDLLASILDAEAQADREGTFELRTVLAEMDEIIDSGEA